jgi:hypothetical protein
VTAQPNAPVLPSILTASGDEISVETLIRPKATILGYEVDEQRMFAQISSARCARTSHLTNPVVDQQTPVNGMPPLTFTAPGGVLTTVATGHLPRIGSVYGYRTLRTEVETMLGEVTFR